MAPNLKYLNLTECARPDGKEPRREVEDEEGGAAGKGQSGRRRRVVRIPGCYTFVRHLGKMGPPSSLLFLTVDGNGGGGLWVKGGRGRREEKTK